MIIQNEIANKYNLKPKDIQLAKILDLERLHQPPFWRNDVVQAWCLSGNTAKDSIDFSYCIYDEFILMFYDQDAKHYAGKIRLSCSAYGGMAKYNFKTFFNEKEIENESDLELQKMLLKTLNWLIDEKIVAIENL